MNFKQITALMLTLPILTSVASASTLSDVKVTISDDYKSVVIGGNVADFNSDILVKVLNPGYKDSDIETALENSQTPILAVDTIASEDLNGTTFSKTIGLRDSIVSSDAIERFYIYLSGDGISGFEPLEMWYVEDIQSQVDAVKAQLTEENLKNFLFLNSKKYDNDPETMTYDKADVLSIKNSMYTENIADAAIAKFIFADKAQITDVVSLKNLLKKAMIAGNFEVSNVSDMTKSNKTFKEIIYEQNNDMAEMESIFSSEMTSKGRETVLNALMGKEWINLASFEKDFAAHILYSATVMNVQNGHGHIPALIQKYESLPEILKTYDYNAYTSLSADKQLLAASEFLSQGGASSPADMHEKIGMIVRNINHSQSNGNDFSTPSYGGGGGSRSHIGYSYLQELQSESDKKEDEWFAGFSDMQNHTWAKEAVSYLTAKGVVSGTSDTTFEPQNRIKREEFTKMLVLAMQYELSAEKQPFVDVPSGAWYEQYVATLKENGITAGTGDNMFNVGANITRQDACTMIYRAAKRGLGDCKEIVFTDVEKISEYAKEAVLSLSAAGIILGNDEGKFNPTHNLTRAEAAVLFYRLMTQGVCTE